MTREAGGLIASVFVLIGVGLFMPRRAQGDTLPAGYEPYISPEMAYSEAGDGIYSFIYSSTQESTGTDSNGGYVTEQGFFDLLITEPGVTNPVGGQYFSSGYVNAGLPFRFPAWNSTSGIILFNPAHRCSEWVAVCSRPQP
jgi:hypothetical protein